MFFVEENLGIIIIVKHSDSSRINLSDLLTSPFGIQEYNFLICSTLISILILFTTTVGNNNFKAHVLLFLSNLILVFVVIISMFSLSAEPMNLLKIHPTSEVPVNGNRAFYQMLI